MCQGYDILVLGILSSGRSALVGVYRLFIVTGG
uniref:Uncharacterized protein n=1 Tax=Siphoviridae sp. cthL03 TaxID=2825615 RepID=A0A8S5PEW1_9CAUD|nr:MAG TPA: hypothetical protein [Siphoviridae sp. cthL03]